MRRRPWGMAAMWMVVCWGCSGTGALQQAVPTTARESALPESAWPWGAPAPEPSDTAPYVPPSFAPDYPIEAAGAWTAYLPFRSSSPTPSPSVGPTPLPGAGRFVQLSFERPARFAAPVGDTLAFKATSREGAFRWGVLEGERARIDQSGVLTVLAPGPIHVFAEMVSDGARRYLLAVGLPASLPVQKVQETTLWGWGAYQAVTWLQSPDEWPIYWQASLWVEQLKAGGLPSLPSIDWGSERLALLRLYYSEGDLPFELTAASSDGIQGVISDTAPDVTNGSVRQVVVVLRVPKALAGVPLDVIRSGMGGEARLMETPPASPMVTPTPFPTPTPDPFSSSVPYAPGEAPPYAPNEPPFPPPVPPSPGAVGACPTLEAWRGERRFSIRAFLDQAQSERFEYVLPVGASIHLAAGEGVAPVRWRVQDPQRARIDASGRLTALAPGPLWVMAESGAERARALIACVGEQTPARRYRFRGDLSLPSDAAPRGAVILRDAKTWADFWARSFLRKRPQAAPEVDFSRHNVVALVDDRVSNGESGEAVLTHVGASGSQVHLVFPGFEDNGGISYRRTVHLFLTGLLAPTATVRLHTFCSAD